ncbi:hypothetical protein BDV97DRAFT_328320 [Delphinella strobiligena]|nr:hypothetical protein BDV97DRAFT_328320 [Delphinella strobiligena]
MFGSSNKFDPNTAIPDLSGKVYVVTGGSAGIGFGICAHILQHNPQALYLLGKKQDHLKEAEEKLKEYGDITKLHPIQIELEDLQNVDSVAKSLASKLDRLDALICNAGLGVGDYNETKDGLDSHMQVNHISQFHLAMLLLPILQKTPNSRLVLQSSDLHRGPNGDAKFESVEEINTNIGPMKLYNRTKFAQVLFIHALKERKEKGRLGFDPDAERGPWLIATHPGGVVTDQQKQAEDAYGTLGKIGVAAVKPFMKDPVDEGCRPALFAATSEDIVKEKIQGAYIVPDKQVTSPSNESENTQLQENLWKLTEQILAQKLGSRPYQTQ